MKKLLLALLLLTLACSPALSESTAPAPFDAREFDAWFEAAVSALDETTATLAENEEGFFEATQNGVTYVFSGKDAPLREKVTGIVLIAEPESYEHLRCPRALIPTNSLDVLLAAYANDNPSLAGTRDEAVLYMDGDLKTGAVAGFLKRDGQRVDVIEHCAFTPLENGKIARSALVYTVESGVIMAIRAIAGVEIDKDAAQSELTALSALQEQRAYFAYDNSAPTPFEREDLTFAGLDFLDVTPEDAQAALGKAQGDDWLSDSTGETLRVMSWNDVSITFLYDDRENFQRADMLTLDGDMYECVRGLRCGDTLDDVLSRFPMEAESLEGDIVTLYGDGVNAPYGQYEYAPGAPTLRYALALDEGGVTLMLSFLEGRMVSATIYHW